MSRRLLHPVKRGLTLVEILICVAIISLLASLMIPGIREARVRAYMTTDTAKLRQLGVSRELYAVDNDGHLVWRIDDLTRGEVVDRALVASPLDPTYDGIGNAWLRHFTSGAGNRPVGYRLSCVSIGDGHLPLIIEKLQEYPGFGWAASLCNGRYNPEKGNIIFAGSFQRLALDGHIAWRREAEAEEYSSLSPFTDRRDLRDWPWPK